MSYQSNPAIDRYLTSFAKELADVPEPERSEVVGEIRSHAAEAMRAGEEPAAIIERFGDPHQLARAYKMELAVKTPLRPLRPLRRVARFFALLGVVALTSLLSFVVIVVLLSFTLAFTVGGVAAALGGAISLVFPVDLVHGALPVPDAVSELAAIVIGVVMVFGGFFSGILLAFYMRMVSRSMRSTLGRVRTRGRR